jgi:hypothetical protein
MPNTQDELLDKNHKLLRALGDCAKNMSQLRRQRRLNEDFYEILQHDMEKEMWRIERELDKTYNETWCKMRKKSKKSIPEFLKETK